MKITISGNNFKKWLAAAALVLVLLTADLAAAGGAAVADDALAGVNAGTPTAELQSVKLNPPNLKRGLPFMEALAAKASAREFSEKELSLQDLSDLLWAADGINRPAENKSTASSAMNAHDIRIYVFMKDGVYLYDAPKHELSPVLAGDFRTQIMMARPQRPAGPPSSPLASKPEGAAALPAAAPPPTPQPGAPANSLPGAPTAPFAVPVPPAGAMPPPPSNPPVQIVLVSDGERFKHGTPEQKFEWGALDAGIVSQNISLFCAAAGLKTRPKASMDKAKIKELLKLTEAQIVFLNHPVGYSKQP